MNFLADCSIRLLNYWAWIQWDAASGINQEGKKAGKWWLSELEVLVAWRSQTCGNSSTKAELNRR